MVPASKGIVGDIASMIPTRRSNTDTVAVDVVGPDSIRDMKLPLQWLGELRFLFVALRAILSSHVKLFFL